MGFLKNLFSNKAAVRQESMPVAPGFRREFRVQHDDLPRAGFDNYRYRIYQGQRVVARYWHDYRGDEHGIEFMDGRKDSWPVGRMIEFLEGGGPQALRLSQRAIEYLSAKVDLDPVPPNKSLERTRGR